MGLDIGVVTIEYMSQPEQPVHDFLFDLFLNSDAGFDDDDETWGGSWAGNGLYEFGHAGLISRADNWANSRAMSSLERAELLSWVADLPWRDDRVMLHLGR